ncbi:phosphoglucosamine mutase [Marinoscillum furvescens]|uniref:Phosphomannomutase n=1 Tax=Marinoscillum furvescens DSM 4134 TaxID=1122208 RepID=A0A3D9L485_MARFU|nr:phosphoglucosamine mutase [Marinoscillum furvescens]REE00423.1 phosphomannomutase [Marinoscillum furvescens DSM 4134]
MSLIKSISGLRGTVGGKVGETLTPIDVAKFAAGYGMWIKERHEAPKVVLGRDARPSGKSFRQIVINTLIAQGIDVVDLGLSTTPTVEMAVVNEKAQGGIILTASHNPSGWNALKLLNENGEFISAADGKKVLEWAESKDILFVDPKKFGTVTERDDYIDWHIDEILKLDLINIKAIQARGFKVAIDAVNSTGGIAVPRLLKKLGVQVTELYCEPNGVFPHNPEPVPENITHICNEIAGGSYDLGFVVDPDVDRLVMVCEDGQPFGEEYTLVSVADYVLGKKPGNTVSNLSSTRALRDVTEKHGGTYEAAAVGEVNVVTKMKETNAVIGGEGNGGVILPELHYGRDALVGIALFLSHLAEFGKSTSMLRAKYPNYYISKNKIELDPELDLDAVLENLKSKYAKNKFSTIDGLKIEFDTEWVHLRKSNTEPIIRIYAESDSQSTADHLAQKLMMDIKELIAN